MTFEREVEDLVNWLRDDLGDVLHGVVEAMGGDGVTYTVHYLRPDIDERYGQEDRQAIARELVFGALEQDYLRDVYLLGEHRFSVEYFDHAAMLLIALDDGRALAIGLAADPSLDHTAIALDCLERLGLDAGQ